MTVLNKDSANEQDLVPAKMYVVGIENLIEFKFISRLYYNQKGDDESLYDSQFIRNFIDFAWEKCVYHDLWIEIVFVCIFTFIHFFNMMYLDLDSCAGELDTECKSGDSIFAIKNGRMHPMIRIVNWIELLFCVR